MREAIRWLVKVLIAVALLPWLGAIAHHLFSGKVCNAYATYCAWATSLIR